MMIDEKERALFNALLKANSTTAPGLLEAVKAYTGAVNVVIPALSSELIIDYGYYKVSYSVPAVYLE